jgi:hypothetical protein
VSVAQLLWAWYGQVWPNLAADVVSLPVAFIWAHRRVMAKLPDRIEAAVGERLAEHHQAVTAHIDRALGAVPQDGGQQS